MRFPPTPAAPAELGRPAPPGDQPRVDPADPPSASNRRHPSTLEDTPTWTITPSAYRSRNDNVISSVRK